MPASTINLIPPRIKKEQRIKQISKVIFAFFTVLLIMILISYGSIFLANYYTQNELIAAEGELAEYEIKIKTLEPLEKDVTLINSKLNMISSLKKDNMLWTEFMGIFENSIPSELYITSLVVDFKAKTITMSGFGETRRDIVKLETKLNTMESLADVGFSSSTYNEGDYNYGFSMTGLLK